MGKELIAIVAALLLMACTSPPPPAPTRVSPLQAPAPVGPVLPGVGTPTPTLSPAARAAEATAAAIIATIDAEEAKSRPRKPTPTPTPLSEIAVQITLADKQPKRGAPLTVFVTVTRKGQPVADGDINGFLATRTAFPFLDLQVGRTGPDGQAKLVFDTAKVEAGQEATVQVTALVEGKGYEAQTTFTPR